MSRHSRRIIAFAACLSLICCVAKWGFSDSATTQATQPLTYTELGNRIIPLEVTTTKQAQQLEKLQADLSALTTRMTAVEGQARTLASTTTIHTQVYQRAIQAARGAGFFAGKGMPGINNLTQPIMIDSMSEYEYCISDPIQGQYLTAFFISLGAVPDQHPEETLKLGSLKFRYNDSDRRVYVKLKGVPSGFVNANVMFIILSQGN